MHYKVSIYIKLFILFIYILFTFYFLFFILIYLLHIDQISGSSLSIKLDIFLFTI
jgi:hypothetical protein